MLDLNPPKVDKKKASYVTRGSNKRKASNNKTQILKKKSFFRGRNPKNANVQAGKEWEANEELTNHEQEDPLKDEDVFALINTSIMNTLITSSNGPNFMALDEDDNKNVGEELQHAELPIVLLNLYSFVC
jgi:hypothetical protein